MSASALLFSHEVQLLMAHTNIPEIRTMGDFDTMNIRTTLFNFFPLVIQLNAAKHIKYDTYGCTLAYSESHINKETGRLKNVFLTNTGE